MRMLKLCLLVLAAASTAACTLLRDPRDAPWDPRDPNQLLTQLHFQGRDNPTQCGAQLRPEERTARHTTRC